MVSKNKAILALSVLLEKNPQIFKQTESLVKDVEKKVGQIKVDVDVKSVSEIFKKTQEITDKLTGVDVSKFYKDIFQSISTKPLEEAKKEIQSIHKDLEKIATLKDKKNGYGIDLGLLSDFNYKDLQGVITNIDKITEATEKADKKLKDYYSRLDKGIKARNISRIKSVFSNDSIYKQYQSQEKINLLSEKLGVSDNKDIRKELKNLNELFGLWEILNKEKQSYLESDNLFNADNAIQLEKELYNISKALDELRNKFKTEFKIKKETFDSILPTNFKSVMITDIFNRIQHYTDLQRKEFEININRQKSELIDGIIRKSNSKKIKNEEKRTSKLTKATKLSDSLKGVSETKELKDFNETIERTIESVEQLDKVLQNMESGSESENKLDGLDIWRQSAESLKEEFGELVKYAVSAEEALNRINDIWKRYDGGGKIFDGEIDEMLYLMKRFDSLDKNFFTNGLSLSDDQKDELGSYLFEEEYETKFSKIDSMTEKQLQEIERLNKAKDDSKHNTVNTSASNEELDKLKQRMDQLETSISQLENKLKDLDKGESFEKMTKDVQELKEELNKTIVKITELTSSSASNSLEDNLSKMGLTEESAKKLGNIAQDLIALDNESGLLSANDNLLETVVAYHEKIKDTNAYIQKGNDLIEERAILLKRGMQVGNEYVMSDSTGKVNIGEGISKYDADSILHTHPFNESRNNLLFSDADIRELLDGTVKKALLLCGDEIATLDMTGVDSSKFEDLKNDVLGAYTAVFARFGAEVKEGKLVGIDRLSSEIHNQAADIINNMVSGIMKNYGGDLFFDKIDSGNFVDNDSVRLPQIESKELSIVQQFLDATTSTKPVENIIALQKKFCVLKEEIKEVAQEADKFENKIIKKQAITFNKEKITGIGYHGAKYAWNTDNFDFNKTKSAQLGSGMYLTEDIEKVSNFGKGQIKQVELDLEKCFILTNDYISSFSDLYKAMGKELPQTEVTAKQAINDVRNYNRTSKENSDSFRQNMLSMGYQGMFVGDNLANKLIPTELVIYDETKLDKLISFTNNEFQELIKNGKIDVLEQKTFDKINFKTPTQEFDNEIQQNLVNLENYKNTIKEIDKLKLEPETDETKAKILELIELSKYFLKNITILKSENHAYVSHAGMKNNYGSFSQGLNNYDPKVLSELYDIGKDNYGLLYSNVKNEFLGIDEEISKIESSSESLRNSLNKTTLDSKEYVKNLRRYFVDMVSAQEALKTETSQHWIAGFNKDIETSLSKFPELLQLKDKFTTEDSALKFIKTDEWNKFLSTLPQAQKYLESIGYVFKEINTTPLPLNEELSGQLALPIDGIKEASFAIENTQENIRKEVKETNQVIEGQIDLFDYLNEIESKSDNIVKPISEKKQTHSTLPLIEESSGQLSFIDGLDKTNQLIEEESGQMALFEVQSKKATNAAVEGQMNLSDYIDQNIKGQITLNDLLKEQEQLSPVQYKENDVNINQSISKSDDQYGIKQDIQSSDDSKHRIKLSNEIVSDLEKEFYSAYKEYIEIFDQFKKIMSDSPVGSRDNRLDHLMYSVVELEDVYPELNQVRDKNSIKYSEDELYSSALKNYLNRMEIFFNSEPTPTFEPETILFDDFSSIITETESESKQKTNKLVEYVRNLFKKYQKLLFEKSEKKEDDSYYGLELPNEELEITQDIQSLELTKETMSKDTNLLKNSKEDFSKAYEEYIELFNQFRKIISESPDGKNDSRLNDLAFKAVELEEKFPELKQINKDNLLKSSNEITDFVSDIKSDIDLESKEVNELVKSIEDVSEITENLKNQKNNIVENNNLVEPQKNENTSKDVENRYKSLISLLNEYYGLRERNAEKKLLPGEEDRLKEIEDALHRAKLELEEFMLPENSSKSVISSVNKMKKNLFEDNGKSYSNYIKSYISNVGQTFSKIDKSKYNDSYVKELNKVKKLISDLRSKLPLDIINDEDADSKLKEIYSIKNNIDSILGKRNNKDSYKLADEKKVYKLQADLYGTLQRNSGMTRSLRLEFEALGDEIKSHEGKIPIDALDEYITRYQKLRAEMEASNKVGKNFAGKVKDKIIYGWANIVARYLSLYDIIRYLRNFLEKTKSYNKALTEMRKVSDETIYSLKEFQKTSFDIADSIGVTAQTIQNSTADWMRLGETLEEATKSAESANILLNVSEFESVDQATESLVAMSAAYKDLEKIDIVDKLNEVGNNYAISTDGLATALQNSASALVTAGNDIDEAVALATAGNVVTQDPNKVGTGLRTISLRITGTEAAKEELEELGEDTSDFVVRTVAKSQQAIKDFTKVQSNNYQGFDILDDNGNFKSTYEIMLGISKIYQEILDTDKKMGTNMANGLLETLAGKNRSNIAASILQNPEILEQAYVSSQNAEGSALRENEKYLESIEGHMTRLSNAWDKLIFSLSDPETINFFIDLATAIVNVTDKVLNLTSPLGALFGIGAGVASYNGLGLTNYVTYHSLRVPFYKIA